MVAPYALTGVTAGAVDEVHAVTLGRCADQQAVLVEGQADVVTAGLAYICPYNVNSIMNPVLAMCLGLGYFFNLYRGRPLVREGGVLIFSHPVERELHPVHHPSVHRLLRGGAGRDDPPSRDRALLRADLRRGRVVPPPLPHLLRLPRRTPLLHVVLGAHALQHVGEVVFVGGDSEACRRMGFRRVDAMRDALEMAEQVVGGDFSLTHFHCPALFY